MRKKLLRLLRIAPLALLFAGVAFAQTTGTIIGVVTDASTGKPVAGAVIVARSPNLQGEQTAVTDANGNYRITLLPPGAYSLAVQLEGFKPAERADITMRTDKTIRANIAVVPEAVQMEEQVVRTGAAPVVNIGAAESGAVVSREFMANIPVGRSVENVATVVPTAQTDSYGVSFAGAQSPENSYIVDGLNVTDPVYGTFAGNPNSQTLTPTLQNNFVQEIDVKTGGFQPEYGRTTGGVLNVVTRSGSNEYHGSVFTDFTPRMLIDPTGKTAGTNGEAIGWRRKPDEGAYDLDFGFEVGGPIMKDKLWFYAGFAPIVTRTYTERFLQLNRMEQDPTTHAWSPALNESTGLIEQDRVPGTEQVYRSGRTTYQYVGKLTYLLDENNNLTLSAVGMPTSATSISMPGGPSRRTFDETGNTFDGSLRYAGKFLEKRLIVEAQAGWHYNKSAPKDKTQAGVDQLNTPTLQFRFRTPVTNFEQLPECVGRAADPTTPGDTGYSATDVCGVNLYNTGGLGYLSDAVSNRLATRVSASYLSELLGSHNTKVGVDFERSTFAQDKRYAGGYYYATTGNGLIYARRGYGYVSTANGRIPATTPGTNTIPSEVNFATRIQNTAGTNSTSVYAQDSWQLPQNVTLNYGIRWEGQSLNNVSNPESNGFTINNSWAPRVQAIWDFTGSGRGKVAGSWGRFFYAMPLDLGDRTFGAERSLIFYMPTSAIGTAPGCAIPGGASEAGMANPTNQSLVTYDTRQLSPSNCGVTNSGGGTGPDRSYLFRTSGTSASPVSPDISQAYVDQFGGQIEYEVLSDLSVGLEYAGRRQGDIIEDMSPNDGEGYYIGNPTKGGEFVGSDGVTYNPSAPTATDTATGRLMVIPFPKPERSYDGVTVSVRKNFSRGWQASASYTYSVLRGNYAGPYRPEDDQLDPGITSQYDIPSIMTNQKGYLYGDRPHQVKLFGSYTWAASPRFSLTGGAAYTGQSGNPISALAGYNDIYDVSQTFVVPRGMAGRSPWTNKVDLRGALEYVIKPPYALKFTVDVFNVLNSEETILIDQDYTYDMTQPISGAKCSSQSAVGKANPVQALQSACPDLKYLKTIDGRNVTVNPNWGRPASGTASFMAPLSLRLGLSLSF
ncbi:conserved hypothetical protein [Anaeromyxobacter sp. K]|uniref:TonB-dependent receptor n=1 Tax=Anaeromyxobacter sp. (strain K) TaxID=447217 RepID=UPI00015F9A59|nr:carboxypeptidase regulatory-like domain-containing protein [Anaeromyxobacter sp. K]ACG71523.1 conserved hypothetical protein [Anaeromyxobacter sp. K]